MPFARLQNPATSPAQFDRPVVAIGNFDGVHRGHQIVLQHAIDQAAARNTVAVALTFEPHPRTVFKPESPVYRLSPASVRASVLSAFGMDGVVELNFNREFASKTAQEFVDEILVDLLGASHVVTGYDFHFGKGREGSPEFLLGAGQEAGFGVTVVEAQNDEADTIISSSRIRSALEEGDVVQAAGLLGYRYLVEGVITQGAQLGRTLGYPTANIGLPPEARLKTGIYAVRFRRSNGSLYDGVASYGRRPTFDNGAPLLETFLFDFSDNLYGETCSVSRFSFLRGEEKFDNVEDLVAQMDLDSNEARQFLMSTTPLTPLDASLSFEDLRGAA